MKVSTELKNFIKRSFTEKRNNCRKEWEERINKEYKDKIEEIEESLEFKNFKEAYLIFKNRFDDEQYNSKNSEEPWYLNFHDGFCGEDFVKKMYWNRRDREADIACAEFDKQCEKVLIQLTYEKDIEGIKELLAKYDIYL